MGSPHLPRPCITMSLCHQWLLSGHCDHNMVMAGARRCWCFVWDRLREGKGPGEEDPPSSRWLQKINKVLVVSDTGRGWRDEREMSCLRSGGKANTIQFGGQLHPTYTSHISFSLTINNHRSRDTYIVLISGPGSCYPEYFLTAVSLSHFPSSGSGVSESLRATEDHKRASVLCPVLCCTVLYCAPLYRQEQGRVELSLQCCHRWTNVDIRSLFVRKYTLWVRICKADI